MGGSSTSLITHSDGATTFSGDLIVEGGGFASARFEQPFELGRDVEALELDAEGDGRLGYKLPLRSAAADASISYQFALPALTAQTSLRLPLSEFRATCRGQPAPDAPLRAEDVCGLGLMLSRYEVAGGVHAGVDPGRRVLPDAAPAQHGRERARDQRAALAPPARAVVDVRCCRHCAR